jgi:tetratricopeptide (TPR) repeat protein
MDENLAQKAVSLALSGDWQEAVKINLQIVKSSATDTDALNRLARAYAEVGEIEKAKSTAEKVIKIDPVNPIATRSLEKWKSLKKSDRLSSTEISSDTFLEEPGKTKIVTLLHTGDSDCLAKLSPGEKVKLLPHAHRVSVVTHDDKYMGRLPDDLAARLRRLIKLGNEYQVLVKTVESKEARVFIREVGKSPAAKDFTSFPTEKIEYISFTPPELVHKDGPVLTLEETESTVIE